MSKYVKIRVSCRILIDILSLTVVSQTLQPLFPDGISYYVVAMARRSSSDLSLLEMHERSSCHPGIRTTVGWTVPIGYLVNTSQISVGEQCNFPRGEAVSDRSVLGCVCMCRCAEGV